MNSYRNPIVAQIAAQYWSWSVRGVGSSYGLGKDLHVGSEEDQARMARSFQRYANGAVPRASTIRRVDKLKPGSKDNFDSILWKILDAPDADQRNIDLLVAMAPNGLRKILYPDEACRARSIRHPAGYIVDFELIARHDSIDALGILLILLREIDLVIEAGSSSCQDRQAYKDLKWTINFLLARLMLTFEFETVGYWVGKLIWDDFFCKHSLLFEKEKTPSKHGYFFLAVMAEKIFKTELKTLSSQSRAHEKVYFSLLSVSRVRISELATLIQSELPFKFGTWCRCAIADNPEWLQCTVDTSKGGG